MVGFEVAGEGPPRGGAIGVILGVYRQVRTEEEAPMALSESAVSELLEAFRAGDGVELVRDAVTMVLQELIEVEATEVIGAARYERGDSRVTDRNGSRPRLLTTQAGDVQLRIPKLRKGRLLPSILEPRRRIDQALYTVSTTTAPPTTISPPNRIKNLSPRRANPAEIGLERRQRGTARVAPPERRE